jgi:hypothetical protein
MKRKTEIENEVEATLNSLEGVTPASPRPFFFTRVQARLNNNEQRTYWEVLSSFIARPAIAFTVIMVIVVMNAVAVFEQTESTPVLADQTEQSAYDEFNLAANSFYDFENAEP